MLNDATGNTDQEPTPSGNGKKLALAFTVLMLLVVAVRVYFVVRERHASQVVHVDEGPSHDLSKDDYIVPRKLYPHTMADARALNGKPIWVFAGGQMNFYPATATHVDFSHSAGLLLGAEQLSIVNFIEQVAPATLYTRVPRGDRQVLMLFRRHGEGPLYAVAVGYHEAAGYTFYLDEAFFHDDPHQTYSHWSPQTWQAIDEHKAILGMTELQADLALGQVSHPGSGSVGNRTVEFDNNGHPVTITFAKKKAVKIE